MSVRKNERSEGTLQVLRLSVDLAKHTTQLCNNTNIFPKSMRFTLTNKMINASIEIMENISLANATPLTEYWEVRSAYQQKALANLYKLETLVRFSYEVLTTLNGYKVAYWTNLIEDTKKSLKSWMKSDEKRIKK